MSDDIELLKCAIWWYNGHEFMRAHKKMIKAAKARKWQLFYIALGDKQKARSWKQSRRDIMRSLKKTSYAQQCPQVMKKLHTRHLELAEIPFEL